MAKLKAPLMSLGASGSLGEALVFFPWKGIHCVRTHVVPTNPNTAAQITQRGHMTTLVDFIHAAQTLAANPFDADDVIACAALASVRATPRTWFNELCKQGIDQLVAGLRQAVYCNGTTTPGASSLAVSMIATCGGANAITAGDFWYGTSRTALINSQVMVIVGPLLTATLAGLTTGTKYYWQFRPTAHADFVGTRSGIYYGVAA